MEVMPDHVHLLVEVDPRFGIRRSVKLARGRSSRSLRGIPPAQEPNPDPVGELLRSLDGRRSTAGRHQAIHRGPKTSVILGQASQGLSLPDAADDGTRSCPQPHGRCSSLGLELGLAPLERPPRRGGEVDPAGATLVGVDRAQAATRNRVTPGGRLAGVAAGPRGPSPTPSRSGPDTRSSRAASGTGPGSGSPGGSRSRPARSPSPRSATSASSRAGMSPRWPLFQLCSGRSSNVGAIDVQVPAVGQATLCAPQVDSGRAASAGGPGEPPGALHNHRYGLQ